MYQITGVNIRVVTHNMIGTPLLKLEVPEVGVAFRIEKEIQGGWLVQAVEYDDDILLSNEGTVFSIGSRKINIKRLIIHKKNFEAANATGIQIGTFFTVRYLYIDNCEDDDFEEVDIVGMKDFTWTVKPLSIHTALKTDPPTSRQLHDRLTGSLQEIRILFQSNSTRDSSYDKMTNLISVLLPIMNSLSDSYDGSDMDMSHVFHELFGFLSGEMKLHKTEEKEEFIKSPKLTCFFAAREFAVAARPRFFGHKKLFDTLNQTKKFSSYLPNLENQLQDINTETEEWGKCSNGQAKCVDKATKSGKVVKKLIGSNKCMKCIASESDW